MITYIHPTDLIPMNLSEFPDSPSYWLDPTVRHYLIYREALPSGFLIRASSLSQHSRASHAVPNLIPLYVSDFHHHHRSPAAVGYTCQDRETLMEIGCLSKATYLYRQLSRGGGVRDVPWESPSQRLLDPSSRDLDHWTYYPETWGWDIWLCGFVWKDGLNFLIWCGGEKQRCRAEPLDF